MHWHRPWCSSSHLIIQTQMPVTSMVLVVGVRAWSARVYDLLLLHAPYKLTLRRGRVDFVLLAPGCGVGVDADISMASLVSVTAAVGGTRGRGAAQRR